MAAVHYADEHREPVLASRRVAVLGYGSQGRSHALNLRDSGIDVRVGLPETSATAKLAREDGFEVGTAAEVSAAADVIAMLVPDTLAPEIYRTAVQPSLSPGQAVVFAHGFAIQFGKVIPAAGIDVVMVAPKAPGRDVREFFVSGSGVPALVAVHQDGTGHALDLALDYADAIGATRAGALETTFAEETETDLFGEQAVLVGGVTALIRTAFEVMVEAGYQPESAYFECLHELKLTVDLVHRHGLAAMADFISDTAQYGGYSRGDRIIDDHVRASMQTVLREIQNGSFAREWMSEDAAGRPRFDKARTAAYGHPVEAVGTQLRNMIDFAKH